MTGNAPQDAGHHRGRFTHVDSRTEHLWTEMIALRSRQSVGEGAESLVARLVQDCGDVDTFSAE